MLIILEGGDGAGKTTLARELNERLSGHNTYPLHRGPIRQHPLREYEVDLEHYFPGSRLHFICDRWHIGELIYGPLLRRRSRLDEPMRRHVDMFLAVRGAVIVHVTTHTAESITRRIKQNGDDLVSVEQARIARARYIEHFDNTLTQCAVCEVRTDRFSEENVDTIIRYARQAEELAGAAFVPQPTRIGRPQPFHVLVGDRVNERPGSRNDGHRAAFVPYENTSGHYLLKSLDPQQWLGAAVVNSTDITESPRRLVPHVALGKNAHARLCELEIPHGVVPHPQFIRRFHHRYHREYGEVLGRALKGEDLLKWRP